MTTILGVTIDDAKVAELGQLTTRYAEVALDLARTYERAEPILRSIYEQLETRPNDYQPEVDEILAALGWRGFFYVHGKFENYVVNHEGSSWVESPRD